jgi:hypothetical protein
MIVLPVTPGIEVVKVSIDTLYFEVTVGIAVVGFEDEDVLEAVPDPAVTLDAIEVIAFKKAEFGVAVMDSFPPGNRTSATVVPSCTYQVVKVVLSIDNTVTVERRIGGFTVVALTSEAMEETAEVKIAFGSVVNATRPLGSTVSGIVLLLWM